MYSGIARLIDLFYWGGELFDEENLPASGPAVIVTNHNEVTGPLGAISSLPLRMYPWIISDMVDPEEAPDYIRKDFIERTLKMKPPRSLSVARLLCRITVPLLNRVGCVPVYRKSAKIDITWQKSLALLLAEKILLITPEYEHEIADPHTRMTSFRTGFARLGEIFHQATGEVLYFYPVAIHESRRAMAGGRIGYNANHPGDQERIRVANMLAYSIREMYMQMAGEWLTGNLPAWHQR